MVRCLTFATQARKCTTSSGLRMIGKVRGFLGLGTTSSKSHRRWRVTRYRNRIAETATLIELASSFFRFVADSNEGGHPFQSDRGHHSNLMAASYASSHGPISVMS